ncbi:hypothetical protein [Raoultella terrigena]|uniref:hypothetical protein n=1 Tax=Raoultella terrigena TaxID=577 RepID=UPI001F1AF9A0|nr:hypothetical protein [Raoultella terrigena]
MTSEQRIEVLEKKVEALKKHLEDFIDAIKSTGCSVNALSAEVHSGLNQVSQELLCRGLTENTAKNKTVFNKIENEMMNATFSGVISLA